MGRYFGTDGVRGVANSELDALLAFKIGAAAAYALTQESAHGRKAKLLIGKDTRVSSDMLENALVAGICSVGADVELLGVIPTPAVAFLTIKHKADAGIVISASHNSFEYNGIKIFAGNGYKLPDETEARIEDLIDDFESIPKMTHAEDRPCTQKRDRPGSRVHRPSCRYHQGRPVRSARSGGLCKRFLLHNGGAPHASGRVQGGNPLL